MSARTSAARSESVTSISWPTAETTGSRLGGDRTDDDLFVERPQVFEAAAAAANDQHIDGAIGFGQPVRGRNARGDFSRCAVALNASRND